MGYLNAPDSGNKLDTLEKMREWKTFEKRSDGKSFLPCTATDMGLGPNELEERDYQCWCEPTPQPVPAKCADYGGDCLCNGLVFQMVKGGAEGEYNFFDAFMHEYTVNNANNTGSMKCSKKNFEGINAAPGQDKVCWCDED